MELVIITGVESYKNDIKQLLKKAGVKAFSYTDVTGFKNLEEGNESSNWFASESGEHQSTLFYAFTDNADAVLSAVKALNNSLETESHVHAAQLDIKNIV